MFILIVPTSFILPALILRKQYLNKYYPKHLTRSIILTKVVISTRASFPPLSLPLTRKQTNNRRLKWWFLCLYSGRSPYGHLTSKKTSPLQSPWLSPKLYSTVQITGPEIYGHLSIKVTFAQSCLKLKCRQYPAIDTNYSCSNCTISN